MRDNLPIIAVTMGDGAGVGPELCLRLLARFQTQTATSIPLILGDYELLARAAQAEGIPFNTPRLKEIPTELTAPAVLELPNFPVGASMEIGRNQACCGRAAAAYIREAVAGCLNGRYAAMVTAPISKKALHLAGVLYPGHTEMLADLTHAQAYAMLLFSEKIACTFVTCHQSLQSVSASLSVKKIVETTMLGVQNVCAMRGIKKSELKVCLLGLNPHAGEEGLFGDEEIRFIQPAKAELLAQGIDLKGPLPSDTAFTPSGLKRYGLYVAMYHDQGGIPFKMLAFDSGVNVTMGLPIIRTSPDHGTAFDIAWQGKVEAQSFLNAYDLAARLAAARSS